jgi:DNA-binding NarL/FixJ family response regulator
MAIPTADAIRDEILRRSHDLDFHGSARVAVGVLRRVVPFDAVAIVAFDPATALPVDKWVDTGSDGSRLIELHDTDFDEFGQLADSGRRAARRDTGFGDELRAVCGGDSGAWGGILMRRERGAHGFTTRDVDLLSSLVGGYAEVQRTRLEQDSFLDFDDRDPGLLLLDDENGIEMADAGASAWLDELPVTKGQLPFVVTSVAQRARAVASGHSDAAATARIRAASGRWVLVSGSVLSNGAHARRTAVTLAPARAPELAEIIADAHGLTTRERCVTELVAQGLTSAAIAAHLHLSTYTVQDHLKAIFEKFDVSSRGQLVARLFLGRPAPLIQYQR